MRIVTGGLLVACLMSAAMAQAANKTASKAASTAAAPTPIEALANSTLKYKATIDAGGQKIEIHTTTAIQRNDATVSIVDTSTTPMGESIDKGVYDRKTLQLTERSVAAGPMSINYKIENNKASGEMSMNGQTRPIAIDLGGATLGDGPGAGNVLAALPLADGYSVALRSINLMAMQTATSQLKVVAIESVTVPAGTFECFKVEVEGTDGSKSTHWIAKAPRKLIKSITTSPQLGGGSLTSELE
jgi:hypothetical protein